jgi:hypothetical protein
MGPGIDMDDAEKRKSCLYRDSNSDPSAVHSVVLSLYRLSYLGWRDDGDITLLLAERTVERKIETPQRYSTCSICCVGIVSSVFLHENVNDGRKVALSEQNFIPLWQAIGCDLNIFLNKTEHDHSLLTQLLTHQTLISMTK